MIYLWSEQYREIDCFQRTQFLFVLFELESLELNKIMENYS
jgi:hypothetical protein